MFCKHILVIVGSKQIVSPFEVKMHSKKLMCIHTHPFWLRVVVLVWCSYCMGTYNMTPRNCVRLLHDRHRQYWQIYHMLVVTDRAGWCLWRLCLYQYSVYLSVVNCPGHCYLYSFCSPPKWGSSLNDNLPNYLIENYDITWSYHTCILIHTAFALLRNVHAHL